MKVVFAAEIEVSVDERFSKTEWVSVTLDGDAILKIADALRQVEQHNPSCVFVKTLSSGCDCQFLEVVK